MQVKHSEMINEQVKAVFYQHLRDMADSDPMKVLQGKAIRLDMRSKLLVEEAESWVKELRIAA